MNEHEQAARNLLRSPDFLDSLGRAEEPMGRAQAFALLAINDQLKSIAQSLKILSKEI